MFGESDSESPRVCSPWDSLAPPLSPPSQNRTPKLVPEADDGNVEYKLQLLSPSPARFARLVTQLKWRLLEGGGQAYYELGVADSGALVGLPRHHLEESLETLEMMACEIGASVTVVKEIEVPPELYNNSRSQLERWESSRRNTRRKDLLRMMKQDVATASVETGLSSTISTDSEEPTSDFPATSPVSPTHEFPPVPLAFDPALAMFTLDIGEDIADYQDNKAPLGPTDNILSDCMAKFSVILEISYVHKPRPMKKRAVQITSPPLTYSGCEKRFQNGHPPYKSKSPIIPCHIGDPDSSNEPHPWLKGVESDNGKGQDLKPSNLLTYVPTELHTKSVNSSKLSSASADQRHPPTLTSLEAAVVNLQEGGASGSTMTVSQEPRLIVEALVVRKLSLDEAFLDFEGFSL